MKKLLRTTICLLAVSIMVLASTSAAFASTVTYKGQAEKFVFAPGSEYSPTDLFTNFKGVMPGDTLIQQIDVRNDASNEVKVKIYMRALGAAELQNADGEQIVSKAESTDFLKEMNLKVTLEGNSVLFDAPADQTAGLTDWVCLGTFYSGADVTLNAQLNVPITMGNDYQERIGALDWQFKVEEFPIENDDPVDDTATKTGDSMNIVIPAVILAAALAGIVAVVLCRRKKQER